MSMSEQEQGIDPGPFNQRDEGGEVLEASPAAEAGEAAPAAKKAPIFRGIQQEFDSVEELSKYALELEKKTLEQEARLIGWSGLTEGKQPQGAEIPQPETFDSAKWGEELILNPAGTIEKIVAHVRSSIMGEISQNAGRTEFYDSFYEANEDLVGCEDLVDASVRLNSKKWEKIPTDQAAKLLAADVRARADKIRATTSRGIPLSNKQPHALQSGAGSGGSGGATAPAAAAAKPLSFADQLKLAQLKRKKRA